MRIAAVVVAWNGGEALERCIASVRGQGIFRLVIVDNASRTAERERLQRLYGDLPEFELLLLPANVGFAAGANLGFRSALEAGAEAVLLATQDVTLEPDALATLAAALRREGAGVAGPLVLDQRDGRELSRGERLVPELICLPRRWLRYRRSDTTPYEVSGLMGCILLLDADLLRQTGGFEPAFFAYYEEVDLCLRARRLGRRLVCVPAARATHDGMRGFLAGFTPLAAELKARNLVFLMRRHGSLLAWVTFVPTYIALLLASSALYALRGRGDVLRALWRGARAGWTGAPPAEAA